jgi:hypothetical protein
MIVIVSRCSNASYTSETAGKSSVFSQKEERSTAVKNFQNAFCGIDDEATGNFNTNGYVIEHTLPQSCEMPLGIAIDKNDARVWYVSTKKGVLGSYDLNQNKFDQEHLIPLWNSRQDQTGFSQVWSVKIADGNNSNRKQSSGGVAAGDIWFTDTQQNAIWRYNKNSQVFEMYKIPAKSSSFGTIYPISLELDSKSNKILFVGTYSPSIWIGDILNMRNGTSDGISQVTIPIDNATTLSGIDPLYVTVGSLAVDNKRNSVWVSVFSYGNRGEIFRYNLESQSFDKRFDLPMELNSPVGMVVVDNDDNDSGNLWITNGGTSIFYQLDTNNGKIIKFVTSKPSLRIFGQGLFDDINAETKIRNNSSSNDNISENAYTLPYWIRTPSDGSLWFNEQEGNKIGRFDPRDMKLIEYGVPSQNKMWGSCTGNMSETFSAHWTLGSLIVPASLAASNITSARCAMQGSVIGGNWILDASGDTLKNFNLCIEMVGLDGQLDMMHTISRLKNVAAVTSTYSAFNRIFLGNNSTSFRCDADILIAK